MSELGIPILVAMISGLVAGLGGILVGAWLTTRRERWNLKRDLYTRLLENLTEVLDALHVLVDLHDREMELALDEQPTDRVNELQAHQAERESKAVREIRLAKSVAAIMLTSETVATLERMEAEWAKARRADTYFEHLDHRAAATKAAYDSVVAAAKKDLKM